MDYSLVTDRIPVTVQYLDPSNGEGIAPDSVCVVSFLLNDSLQEVYRAWITLDTPWCTISTYGGVSENLDTAWKMFPQLSYINGDSTTGNYLVKFGVWNDVDEDFTWYDINMHYVVDDYIGSRARDIANYLGAGEGAKQAFLPLGSGHNDTTLIIIGSDTTVIRYVSDTTVTGTDTLIVLDSAIIDFKYK